MRNPRLLLFLLLLVGAVANAFFMLRAGTPGDPEWWRSVIPLYLLGLAPLAVVGLAAWLAGAVRWRRLVAGCVAATVVFGGLGLLISAFVVDPQPLSGVVFLVLPVLQLVVAALGLAVIGGSRIHERITAAPAARGRDGGSRGKPGGGRARRKGKGR